MAREPMSSRNLATIKQTLDNWRLHRNDPGAPSAVAVGKAIAALVTEVEGLQSENATLHEVARELLQITLWTQECAPETLAEYYGDVGPTIERAEKLLGPQ